MTHLDVKSAILAQANPERAQSSASFFKTKPGQYGEGDQFMGLSMPQQHAIAKQYLTLSIDDVEQLVHEPFHEMRMTGLLIWVYQARKAGAIQQAILMDRYVANRRYVNNWDLVDVSCPYLVGQPLLQRDRSILYDLVQEDHLWSQRMAIVSTVAFIRAGQFADTLAIAELLLTHKHDLIHKAVGWMLREVGKRNIDALDEFLHDYGRQMPRTSLRYAIERFELARRTYYLTR
ncbi:DNA alkylation repair protein [Spirosoma agri]|uniref:DNA alkylation repair protein n=1 Tax=Spirosoma agri TaxID=1987381 RepID=A0A6M0IC28_9BACT|nr:DNA alkylation repair protein [Spirosoma agri]NEU65734.1 DNA alkylation repair protein [Spirosoma agri]